MPLITCDICDKHNVPGSHGQDSTGCDVTQCYVCGGDEFDPYCEMEEATVIPFPTPVDYKAKTFARISAVVRVAQELHDERDPECPTWFRKLEACEGVFLAEVDRIQRHYRHSRAMGLRDLGDGEAYDALCFLNYRTEADHLEAALADYRAASNLDAVAQAMQEAAE